MRYFFKAKVSRSWISFLLSLTLLVQVFGPGIPAIKDAIALGDETPPAPCVLVADGIYSNTKTTVANTTGAPEASVQLLTTIHPAWTADVDGTDTYAKWIWTDNPVLQVDTQTNVTKTFSRSFQITGTTTAAQITIAADNFYTVWLNGNLVGSETSNPDNFTLATQDTYDVSNFLVPGTNTLRIEVTNLGVSGSDPASNPAGLLYGLSYTLDRCATGGSSSPTNPSPTPELPKVSVIFKKYIEGLPATEGSFKLQMDAQWGGGAGSISSTRTLAQSGNFTTDTPGMTNGNNTVTAQEVTGGNSGVLPRTAQCQSGMYQHVGYTFGPTLEAAKAMKPRINTPTITLSNITSDQYVIVWNEICPITATTTPPTEPSAPISATVNLCSVDTNANPLSGWALSFTNASSSTQYATTTANGCATLSTVPFGSYTLGATIPLAWTNVSGLGSVTVASTTHTFTIVNNPNTSGLGTTTATTTTTLGCTSNCSSGNSGGGGDSGTPPSITTSRSGGGGGVGNGGNTNGQVAGASTSALPEGEVLGAYTELPGIPNTGLGPRTARSNTSQALMVVTLGFLILSTINFRAFKQGLFQ